MKTWMMVCALAAVACGGKIDDVTSAGQALSSKCGPKVPTALEAPAGQKVAMSLDAVGVQIYDCKANGWVFRAPEATLYNPGGQEAGIYSIADAGELLLLVCRLLPLLPPRPRTERRDPSIEQIIPVS